MSRDSEVTSECTPSIRMGSDDDLSSPRLKYLPDDSSRETSPSGRRPWEVFLPDN